MELFENPKTFPLTVFQPVLGGWIFRSQTEVVLKMTEKTEVNLFIMPFSIIQKYSKMEK